MKTIKEKNKGLFNAIERVLIKRLSGVENYMDDNLMELYKKHKIDDGALGILMDELRLAETLIEITNGFWKNETNLEIDVFYKDADVYRFYIKGAKKGKGYDVWSDGDCGFDYETDYSEDKFMGRILND